MEGGPSEAEDCSGLMGFLLGQGRARSGQSYGASLWRAWSAGWLWQSLDEAMAVVPVAPGPAHPTQWLSTVLLLSGSWPKQYLNLNKNRCKFQNTFTFKKFTHFQNRGGPDRRENGSTWTSTGVGVGQGLQDLGLVSVGFIHTILTLRAAISPFANG